MTGLDWDKVRREQALRKPDVSLHSNGSVPSTRQKGARGYRTTRAERRAIQARNKRLWEVYEAIDGPRVKGPARTPKRGKRRGNN